jgi:RNA polymerase sigma factor (sigma-70 family)
MASFLFDYPQLKDFPKQSSNTPRETEFDPEFLHDFADGNEVGLSRLYTLYHSPLIKYGLRIVQDYFAVENIVQDAFLKAWTFRHRLNSYMHAYRFMRMNVKWDCYDYYKKPEYRLVVYSEYETYPDAENHLQAADQKGDICRDEEMLKSIYKIIPYLPPNRQTILKLYFKYGFSYKQIAKRYGSNIQSITKEIYESLGYLKNVIHAKRQITVSPSAILVRKGAEECLSGEMLQLFKLRYEGKLPFDVIANKMNLSQAYVQQQYVIAHRKLNELKVNRRQ